VSINLFIKGITVKSGRGAIYIFISKERLVLASTPYGNFASGAETYYFEFHQGDILPQILLNRDICTLCPMAGHASGIECHLL
jgi:hypothetical protein